MPDDAAPLCRAFGISGTRDRFRDSAVLLVARDLSDGLAGLVVALEDGEVAEHVQQDLRGKQAREKRVLGRGRSLDQPLHVALAPWICVLPLGEEPRRRGHRSKAGRLPARGHQDLDRLEKPRHPKLAVVLADLLVAQELLDGLGPPLVAQCRALALDDRQRNAVHDHHHIGDDLLLHALDPVLARDDQLVLAGVVEVEKTNRLPFLPSPRSCSSEMP